ncbi:unnamed protein product [Cyprideis torosa]|uniref:glycerol kinase n=1 Tax=Cyprideis torosa TaxID=163714 RepID=A0A7R8W615_9CRUS|nr:unnamed protein product [Cyprideis torosa]CAG0882082.1 unnamed protein product [Cyprideis torosa]
MLMNIKTLKWDEQMCKFFGIPSKILPEIRTSSEIYAKISRGLPFGGVPISAVLGDQQAALVGQLCFSEGEAKNTYGTGCFLLCNTGKKLIYSSHGLLTTVAYKFGNNPPSYALEGSIANAGNAVLWLRDNLGILKDANEVEQLASEVPDSGDCYFVPAFGGLFAPYWRTDARGVLCGLSQKTTKQHIARATLESVAFQTRELLDAINSDAHVPLRRLQVDGGMSVNSQLMQFQADILGIPVARSSIPETTALGAAVAAGMAEGVEVWSRKALANTPPDKFLPTIDEEQREAKFLRWKMAVVRALDWKLDSDEKSTALTPRARMLKSLPLSWFLIIAFGLTVWRSSRN